MQQGPIKTPNGSMRLSVPFFPNQFTGLKCGFRLRIGNELANNRVRKGGEVLEFFATTLGDHLPQAFLMIGEEQERRARRPLLTHEQQWCRGTTQQQGRHCPIGSEIDLMMKSIAERSVADLIMVLQAVNESTWRNSGRIG